MKRFITFLLAFTMLASMGSGVYAEEGPKRIEGPSDSASLEVSASYEAGDETQTVYSVTVTWVDLTFAYSVGGSLTWNPNSLTYDNDTRFSWTDGSTRQVTVTNRSNAPVTVTAKAAQTGKNYNVILDVGPESQTIAAGIENLPKLAPTGTIHVMVKADGHPDLTAEPEAPLTIGTVTLTVTAAQEASS